MQPARTRVLLQLARHTCAAAAAHGFDRTCRFSTATGLVAKYALRSVTSYVVGTAASVPSTWSALLGTDAMMSAITEMVSMSTACSVICPAGWRTLWHRCARAIVTRYSCVRKHHVEDTHVADSRIFHAPNHASRWQGQERSQQRPGPCDPGPRGGRNECMTCITADADCGSCNWNDRFCTYADSPSCACCVIVTASVSNASFMASTMRAIASDNVLADAASRCCRTASLESSIVPSWVIICAVVLGDESWNAASARG
jgi:hypothetical protein